MSEDTTQQGSSVSAPMGALSAGQRAMVELTIEKDKTKPAVTDKPQNPEDKYPKFLSTTGKDEMIALLSGHTVAISATVPTPLHPRFHRKAVETGCMPEAVVKSMRAEGVEGMDFDSPPTDTRREIILRNISMMVEQAELNPTLQPRFFTNDDKPDVNELTKRCGFKVTAGERDKCWEEYQAKLRNNNDEVSHVDHSNKGNQVADTGRS